VVNVAIPPGPPFTTEAVTGADPRTLVPLENTTVPVGVPGQRAQRSRSVSRCCQGWRWWGSNTARSLSRRCSRGRRADGDIEGRRCAGSIVDVAAITRTEHMCAASEAGESDGCCVIGQRYRGLRSRIHIEGHRPGRRTVSTATGVSVAPTVTGWP